MRTVSLGACSILLANRNDVNMFYAFGNWGRGHLPSTDTGGLPKRWTLRTSSPGRGSCSTHQSELDIPQPNARYDQNGYIDRFALVDARAWTSQEAKRRSFLDIQYSCRVMLAAEG